jgi:DNA replication protein DnaC
MNYQQLIDNMDERIATAKEEQRKCGKCGGTGAIKLETLDNADAYHLSDLRCECQWKIASLKQDKYDYEERYRSVSRRIPDRYWTDMVAVDLSRKPAIEGNTFDTSKNIILQGVVGNGKTTILYKWMFYATIMDAANIVLVNYSDIAQDEYKGDIYNCDVLIIDDFAVTKNYFNRLYSVINSRWNNLRSTWVSMNNDKENEIIANVGKQVWDRIKSDSIVIPIKHGSYRKIKEVK